MLESEACTEILGFYTLTMDTVLCDVVPARDLPRGQHAPVILLAQFGVDIRHQAKGYGKDLLYHALLTARLSAENVGCLAVVLDAATESARSFYLKRGFEPLLDDQGHLWLSMKRIRAMFSTLAE